MTTTNLDASRQTLPSSRSLVIANWKAEGSLAGLKDYLASIDAVKTAAHIVICPPHPLLLLLHALAEPFGIKLGGQNCRSAMESGASGGVGASLLREVGCDYVMIGHADRRLLGDNDTILRSKLELAAGAGLVPIFCVSDGEEQLTGQLMLLSGIGLREVVIAYEPMWAIGSGRTPAAVEIEHSLSFIIRRAEHLLPNTVVQTIYGGSVTAQNVIEIVALPSCRGVLVGKAACTGQGLAAILGAVANQAASAV